MKKTKLSLSLALAFSSPIFASSIQLDKITITTPTKSAQLLQNTTANVDIITADEIQQRGYTTLQQALSSVSGINLSSNGGLGQSSSIKVRGFDSKRVLVLIDGVRYNNPTSLDGAEFSNLMIENVKQIEIVKGAQSGVWGADATAGVINIITKKTTKNGFNASINGESGSFNTQKYGFSTGYKQEKFDISLNAQRLTTDGFSAKVPKDMDVDDFEDDSYENNSADIKAGFNITNRDRVELFYNYIDSSTNYDGFNSDPIKSANDSLATVDSKQQFFGANYTRTVGENQTKLYVNRSKFERYYPNGYTKNFDGSVDEVGLNSVIKYAKDGYLSMGLDHKKFTHKNEISKNYTNQGVFITNLKSFEGVNGGKTIFSQSLRFDKFESFDNQFTYKIGVKRFHKHIKDFWTSINYATAYNIPSLYHLYSPFGNILLNPEETKELDITLNYKGIGVTYFRNSIDNMIDYDFVTSKYANIKGKSKLNGVEVAYSNTSEALSLAYNINYTYLKAEDKDGKKLLRRPKNSANLSLDYYGLGDAHVGALIQHVGEQDDTSGKIKGYTVVDFIADYDINLQFNIYTKINNIFDRKYQKVIGYSTSQRAFYLGFRYTIK